MKNAVQIVISIVIALLTLMIVDWMPEWLFFAFWLAAIMAFCLGVRDLRARSRSGNRIAAGSFVVGVLGSALLILVFAASCFGGWLLQFK